MEKLWDIPKQVIHPQKKNVGIKRAKIFLEYFENTYCKLLQILDGGCYKI